MALTCGARAARAEPVLAEHDDVAGDVILQVDAAPGGRPERVTRWQAGTFSGLSGQQRAKGPWLLRWPVPPTSAAVRLPVCAGRGRVWIDGEEVRAAAGPIVLRLAPREGNRPHEAVVAIAVGGYEGRIACGEPPRGGVAIRDREGLGVLTFSSKDGDRGGGSAVVFIPKGHDVRRPSPLLVGAHPWNGSPWTYAAYAELLDEAQVKDVVLLMPSGLGNSLYTRPAEAELLSAILALESLVAIDPVRVSIWGASMGGAGATTIAFHHPDAFAGVTSFFGDSKYDLTTYVRAILGSEAAAHEVNALDIVDNARYLPVLLVHGEEDHVSPIRQSEMLADAMRSRGYPVSFIRVPGAGHEGRVVAAHVSDVVDRAESARAPVVVPRVTYRSVRADLDSAYGVRFVRQSRAADAADAFVDVARKEDGVHVLGAANVASITLARGALGAPPAEEPAIVKHPGVAARWDTLDAGR